MIYVKIRFHRNKSKKRDLTVGKNNTDITLDEFSQSVPITKGNKASSENMRKVWNKHIKDSIGKIKIREITRADINKWIKDNWSFFKHFLKRGDLIFNDKHDHHKIDPYLFWDGKKYLQEWVLEQ